MLLSCCNKNAINKRKLFLILLRVIENYKPALRGKGGKGLFIKDIQNALKKGEADIAVHSMKDVPIDELQDFALASILERDSPYDVLISKYYHSLQELPVGAVLGTSSFRREGQLIHLYPHLKVKLLRGNINTRISKCMQEEYDAIILAKAGIDRMQMGEYIKEVISEDICLPAIGQGAIGIECLKNNHSLIAILRQLDHQPTRVCVETERVFNKHLGGNCHSPVACYAILEEKNQQQQIFIRAVITTPHGEKKLSHQIRGDALQYIELAEQLAQKMIDDGALSMMNIMTE